jgi:putative flippase GtrA
VNKNRWKLIIYGMFGIFTTASNYGIYLLCTRLLGATPMAANVVALITSKLVAFVTNKIWVFRSKSWKIGLLLHEFISFVLARLFTTAIDLAGFWILLNITSINDLIAKIIMNIVVIILNYFLSTMLVFRDQQNQKSDCIE